MTRPDGLAAVTALARRLPDLRIVLCHVAHVRIDGQAPDRVWFEGLAVLTPYANVFMKVSGMAENTGIQAGAHGGATFTGRRSMPCGTPLARSD